MIEYADEQSQHNEAEHGSNDSQKADDSKVLKEVRLSKVVSRGKDDGWQDEGEEDLVGELDVFVNGEGEYSSDGSSQSNGYY